MLGCHESSQQSISNCHESRILCQSWVDTMLRCHELHHRPSRAATNRRSRVTIADGHHAGLPRVLTTEHFELPRIADPVSIVGGHHAELSRTLPQTVSSCHESRIQSDNREWLKGDPAPDEFKESPSPDDFTEIPPRMILQRAHSGCVYRGGPHLLSSD